MIICQRSQRIKEYLFADRLIHAHSDFLRQRLANAETGKRLLTGEIRKFRGSYKGPKKVEELVDQYSGALGNLGQVLANKNAQKQKATLWLLVDRG